MTLRPGSRLGAFVILEHIGAGGMGSVYKARDSRLDRIVAIKVLPDEVAFDPERRASDRSPPGDPRFERGFSLWAVPFDSETLQVTGEAFPLRPTARNVGGSSQYATAPDGTFAYVPGTESKSALVWVDRDETESVVLEERGTFQFPRLSPEGARLAVTFAAAGDREIYIYDLKRVSRQRLTSTGVITGGEWTPDGTHLAFTALREGSSGYDLHWQAADGSGVAEVLLTRTFTQVFPAWSPDGKRIAYTETHPVTGRDIWVLPVGGEPEPFVVTPFSERVARSLRMESGLLMCPTSPAGTKSTSRDIPKGEDISFRRPGAPSPPGRLREGSFSTGTARP
jgi:hypothetical protein